MIEEFPLEPTKKVDDPYMHFAPLVIEREGVRFNVFVLSDIDGTVNNEYLPEGKRIESIEPAKQAFSDLEARGIPVGLISARSYGEVEMYKDVLDIKGPSIFEDGGGIALPRYEMDSQKLSTVSAKSRLAEHGGRKVLLLSSISSTDIKRFLQEIEKSTNERIISTCTSSALELQNTAGHGTLKAAQLSMERLVSAYAVGLSHKQRTLAELHAAERGIRTFTSNADAVTLFFGVDAHKGDAIEFLCNHADLFFSNKNSERITPLPIVIGNHSNDIPLLKKALSKGGIAVLVAKEDGSYATPTENIPDGVLRMKGFYGFGIQEAIPEIFSRLRKTYNMWIAT